jgi:hypothetical protein
MTTASQDLRARPTGRFAAAEAAVFAVVGLALLHHTDHVLRGDHSGWPFKDELTPFTISLVIYPLAFVVMLQRRRPWLRVGLMSAAFLATQATHVFVETPADQHGMWATNMSTVDDTLGDPNLLDLQSGLLGYLAAGVSILLSLAMLTALFFLLRDTRRPGRAP